MKEHRLLRPQTHGGDLEVVFGHPLGRALHSLPRTVYTRGTAALEDDLPLRRASGASRAKVGEGEGDFGSLFRPDVAALLAAASPSPFGRGEETAFDESVRRGKEVTAETLSVPGHSESRLLRDIKDKVRRDLFPSARDLSLRLYKLAVYEAGGHFASHRDTTHAANHHATLLVEAKSAHRGGALVFEVHGVETEGVDFSASNEREIAWIAFYTDVRHRVEPVTEGVRIVLQFDVLVEKNVNQKGEKEKEEEGGGLASTEAKKRERERGGWGWGGWHIEKPYLAETEAVSATALTDEGKLDHVLSVLEDTFAAAGTEQDILALPLFHLYRTEAILPEFLKGVDRLLFFTLLKTGLYDLALSPVVIDSEIDQNYPEDNYTASLTDPIEKIYTGVQDGGPVEVSVGDEHIFNARDAQYIVSDRESSKEIEFKDADYTGNEAEPAAFKYFLGVILVRMKEQQRKDTPAKKKSRKQSF